MIIKDAILAMVIILIWGVNFVVISWGLENMPPLLMGGLRFLLVFMLGCWFFKRPFIPLKWMLCYALTISFAQFSFLFMAMSIGMPAGLASIILQSQALFTLLFSFLMLNEAIRGSQLLAIVVAGIGLTIIGSSSGDTSMNLLGFGLTIMSACSWAVGNLITRSLAQKGYKVDAGLVIWSAAITSIPFFISSYFIEGHDVIFNTMTNINLVSILALLYLALLATFVGYSLWSYLLTQYPAGVVAPLTLGVPVVGLIAAWFFLGEQLNYLQCLGAIVVMVGLSINVRVDRLLKRVLLKRS